MALNEYFDQSQAEINDFTYKSTEELTQLKVEQSKTQ